MWRKKEKKEKPESVRDEVMRFLTSGLRLEMTEMVTQMVNTEVGKVVDNLPERISSEIGSSIEQTVKDIRLVFPAWGDIEKVVRDTMQWNGQEPLRGWMETSSICVSPTIGEVGAALSEVSVPLSIVGVDIPETATMLIHCERKQYRETKLVQVITGAMLKKWTLVPIFRVAVSDYIRITLSEAGWDSSEGKIIIQYVSYERPREKF